MPRAGYDAIAEEIDRKTEALLADFNRYSLTEDADPEGYLERQWTLLEKLRQAPDQDHVSIEAFKAFFNRVERLDAVEP